LETRCISFQDLLPPTRPHSCNYHPLNSTNQLRTKAFNTWAFRGRSRFNCSHLLNTALCLSVSAFK
jgi:hypothetical protein